MNLGKSGRSLDAGFDDREFENIFLRDQYPGEKTRTPSRHLADKAELWALYDAPARYHGLDMVRQLRALWGIHVDLRIGPRSVSNPSARGYIIQGGAVKNSGKTYFEGYVGNISDATRAIVTMAPYDHGVASRALSQKFFVRIIVPLKGLNAMAKVDALLLAYTLAWSLDERRFAGIVDPDTYLFVPPANVVAGITNYRRPELLLNTHLLTGFNFYQLDEAYRFFTHGFDRFGMPNLLVQKTAAGKVLTRESYTAALKAAHGFFLDSLTGKKSKKPAALKKGDSLPEQVKAMAGKKVADLPIGG